MIHTWEPILALKSLNVTDIYNNTSTYQTLLSEALEFIQDNNIDLTALSVADRKELGFRTYSETSGAYELIPLYIAKLLPKEILVYCPLFEGTTPKPIGSVNDDVRCGCIAYQIVR